MSLDFIRHFNTTRVNYAWQVLTTVKESMINILNQLSFSKNCKKELSLNMPSSQGEEEEVYLYPCPTPALDGGGWPTPRSGHFTAGKGARYTS